MATKLKNLKIRKVDFVDEGANPDAHIRMLKRRDGETQTAEEDSKKGTGSILKRLFGFIGKAAGMNQQEIDSAIDEIQKGDSLSFNEKINEVKNYKIADEMWDTCYALHSSLCSILNDEELDSTGAATAMQESLDEFYAVAQESIKDWSSGKSASIVRKSEEVSEAELKIMKSAVERLNETIEKACKDTKKEKSEKDGSDNNENPKGDEEEMKIDKSKLTDAERAFLENIEKRCGVEEGDASDGSNAATAPASAEQTVTKSAPEKSQETPAGQADIAKGAFRPHTALSNMALAYYQSDAKSFAKTIFPICPVSLSSDNYYIFDKEDLMRDNWHRKPAYGKVDPAVLSEHTETYACVVDQMIMGIDQIRQTDLNRRMGPRTADPKQQRTKTMAGQANIHQDAWFARQFFKKGVWGQEFTGVDSTTVASGQFIKFSNANSDVVWWRTFTIIKKKGKEKRELSEYELKQKAQDKRKRQIKAMQKEMSAERADFIKLAIEQKFKPENEKPEAVMERLFGVMVRCGSWMSETVMLKFITGETSLYDKSDEEKAAYEKQRDAIGLLYKLMIYAADGVADKDIAEWNADYRKGAGELVMQFDEILSLFGFSYSKEEYYKLAEGSHDLFKEAAVNGK